MWACFFSWFLPIRFMDVTKEKDRDRLFKAIRTSREAMDTNFRRARTEFIRTYVGPWYSANGTRMVDYVNFLNQTARIYTMALAYNNPMCRVTTFDPKLWPFAKKFETNINKVIANIDLRTTFQMGMLDAFFCLGIFKIRLADAGLQEIDDNVWIDPGKPWVDRVSFDNAILDMSATDRRTQRFMGDRYRASYRKVEDREDYNQDVVAKLTPSSKYNHDSGSDYAAQIATGNAVDDDELEPMLWLQDIYIPETRQMATLATDDASYKPLKVWDWDGHPSGPYKYLGLGMVPDNIMDVSPAANLKALADLGNRLYRKLSAQASRQKNVVAFAPGAGDDAQRAMNARDGEYVQFRDPNSLKPVSFPGVDGATNAFFLAVQEVYNTQAGNQRAIGGLGQEADTLGQEQIIQQQSGGMIASMRNAVNQCASEICREIGNMMFDDEAMVVNSSVDVENTGYFLDTTWWPGEREGTKDHYVFAVEPFSMAYQSPEQKLAQIMRYLGVVGNVFPMVQAGLVDIQELTKIVSEYQNTPEMQRIFKFMSPEQFAAAGMSGDSGMGPAPDASAPSPRPAAGPRGQGMAQVLGQMMQGRGQSAQGVTIGS